MKKTFLLLIILFLSACRGPEETPPVPASEETLTSSVTLAWDAPTTYVDGSLLEDGVLAGYKIYHGTSSADYSTITDVGNITTYTMNDLASGTWYFAVTAYDVHGYESAYSNEVVKIL